MWNKVITMLWKTCGESVYKGGVIKGGLYVANREVIVLDKMIIKVYNKNMKRDKNAYELH